MVNFCLDGFWNSSLFNQPQYPEFTQCFQFTLLFIPTAVLLLSFIPFLLLKQYEKSLTVMKLTPDLYYFFKLAVHVFIGILLIVEVVLEMVSINITVNVDYLFVLSYIGLFLSIILVMFLTEIRRRYYHPVCPIISSFWFLLIITYFIRFFNNVFRLLKLLTGMYLVVYLIVTSLIFLMIFLSILLDSFPRYSKERSSIGKEDPCPDEYASIISRLTYSWIDRFILRWFKNDMTEDTVFELHRDEECLHNTEKLEKIFTHKIQKIRVNNKLKSNKNVPINTPDGSTYNLLSEDLSSDQHKSHSQRLSPGLTLFSSLFGIYKYDVIISWMFKLVHDVVIFALPFLLKVLINMVGNPKSYAWQGYCIAVGFMVFSTVASVTENFCFYLNCRLAIRVRGTVTNYIYRKSLKISSEVRNKYTSGEIVNYMSVDADRLMKWITYSWFIFSSPLQIVACVIFLYYELGYSIFAGLGSILILVPVNAAVMKFSQKYSVLELDWKDKRLKILGEIFKGIKVLKMYAWEPSFNRRVSELRNREMTFVRNVTVGWAFVSTLWDFMPFLVMLTTFITYVYSSDTNIITAEKAFVSLALFNLLRFPMTIFPWGLTESVMAIVSLKRIGEFLVSKEIDKRGYVKKSDDPDNSSPEDVIVDVDSASFSWKKDDSDKPVLNQINFQVKRGQLVAIVGKVGVGKSSLLSAILGEMNRIDGSITVKGDIAYVPQEAWIQNMSVRDNIIFTRPYNERDYHEVVHNCCLQADLDQLPAGDTTEIGERGINLSGGQKQRISLARAVYQLNSSHRRCSVYLLDDPLSAVDAHVGLQLFERVIGNTGCLSGTTRILVTHGVHWLPRVDEVVVIDEDGQIKERGSYKQLMKNGKEFNQFIQSYLEANLMHEEKITDTATNINNRLSDGVVDSDVNTTGASADYGTSQDKIAKARQLLQQLSEDENVLQEVLQMIPNSPPQNIAVRKKSSAHSRQSSVAPGAAYNPILESGESGGHWTGRLSGNDTNAISSPQVTRNLEQSSSSYHSGSGQHAVRKIHRQSEAKTQHNGAENDENKPLIKPLGQLTDQEEAATGRISWSTYLFYFKSWGNFIFVVSLLGYMCYMSLQITGNMWIEKFTSDPEILNASAQINSNRSKVFVNIIRERTNYYMSYYTIIGIGQLLTLLLFWCMLVIGVIRSSKGLHMNLLNSILRSPMAFFDTTPTGRILNRFSKDIETIDHVIPFNVSDLMNCGFQVLASVIVIIVVTPWFALVIIPIAALYYIIQYLYMPTCRQSRRLCSIANSPIFNTFSETLNGTAVIRAFEEETHFNSINEKLIDRSNNYNFIQWAAMRWLSLRLDALGNLMIFASALFAVLDRGNLTASMIGLSITYALQITDTLNWLIRQYTEMETNAVSIERVHEYSQVPSESPWSVPSEKPSDDWPDKGQIEFRDFDFRYRDGLPLVLNSVNLSILPGEKVGVVGRTGAGKSSLTQALFRLAESAGGSISIDAVRDISRVGLHDLRQRLTILPQDPVIFSGSLRDNLDPFNEWTDEQLMVALQHSNLMDWFTKLPSGLDYECGESGANLSTGQKQLLCLSRALLRKSKVLILDEATASVDVETDRLVMTTIRKYFHNSTVIIIAHRINTILDCDRVLVLDNGSLKEFDSPNNLMANPDSLFKSLADQSAKHEL